MTSTLVDASPDVFALVAALPHEGRARFARDVAARARDLGLVYWKDDTARPIAVALPRSGVWPAAMRERGVVARTTLTALMKTARAVLEGVFGDGERDALLAELSPFEREIVLAGRFDPPIATARADMLIDDAGRLRLIEMNATIPAMQGYSDIAVAAFVDVARAYFGSVVAAPPSNAATLLRSLVARYREDGGAALRPSIALVHRRGDSQLFELRFLAERFREHGHDAHAVVVDDVGAGSFDVFYRHIFASRVEGTFAAMLREPRRHHVYNGVAAPLEQKGLLALLATIVDDDDERVALSDDERRVVARHVPFTRRLVDASTSIDGSSQSLPSWVRGHQHDVVVKRSHDFGGKSVVLGDSFVGDWGAFVDRCVAESGWVVQERVRFSATTLTLATPDAASDEAVFVDASAYAAIGGSDDVGACVSRVSRSAIVNIQQGGGLLPVL